MTLPASASFALFLQRVLDKFDKASSAELRLKFRDEEGGMVSMRDEGDFELAVEVAREMSYSKDNGGNGMGNGGMGNGMAKEGKLEVWCVDA